MDRKSFTTMEIVLMALLAVANGILTNYMALLNKILTASGGPIATSTIVGIYMIYGLLAMYIIRKPGAALFTYLIGAIVQTLLGISYGMPSAFAAALCYAAATELIFFLYRYRRWNSFSLMLASLVAVPLWYIVAAFMFGYWQWDISVLIIAFIIRCASGIVLCGLVTKWIGDLLVMTGLLRSFAIGKKQLQEPNRSCR